MRTLRALRRLPSASRRTMAWSLLPVAVVLLSFVFASPALAGVHSLGTITDNSADADPCAAPADVLMVTITSSGSQGGNDATSTLYVGMKSGGTDYYAGLLAEWITETSADAPGMATAGAYLRTKYGV